MTTVAQPQDRNSLDQEQFLTILSREEAVRRFEAALFPRPVPSEPRSLADALGCALAVDVTAPIDVPPFDRANVDGFAAECAQARDMGLDGKTLIHPSQIDACNAAFSPSADEVAQARRIIAAFDAPENRDKGVVALDDRMVERLHAEMARRTVAIADAIASR